MIEEKKYTDAQIEEMEDFIGIYFNADDNQLDTEDEDIRIKYKEYVEALCSIDNIKGLRTKAYACYGRGNIVYPTDWKTSEECLLKLVELDNDPWAANSLGYIYYYGRTTNSIPDYDRAFKYFSVAALYGIYEAIYKIADLCLKGKGVPMKCIRSAENIINWLYNEVKPGFLNGDFDGQFADVASRMGRIYLAKAKESSTETDDAYKYFLEALCALKLREPYNHYGDTSVLTGVRNGLVEAKANVSFKNKSEKEKELLALDMLFDELNCRNMFKVEIKKKGKNATISISEIGWTGNDRIFAVLPTIGYCEVIDKFKLSVSGVHKLKKKYTKECIFADYIWIDNNMLVILSNNNRINCRIKANSFELKHKVNKVDTAFFRMVSVEFNENGRLYDYIYDLNAPIAEGEKVVVLGHDGETVVTVRKVYTVTENELGLPIEKYKKVIRKE